MACFIVIPLAAGVVTRTWLIRSRGAAWFEQSFLPRFQPVAVLALLATLVLIFAFQADNITHRFFHVVLIAFPILIQVYFNSSLAYGLMKLFRVPHSVAAPGALIGASNFFELAVAVRSRSVTSAASRSRSTRKNPRRRSSTGRAGRGWRGRRTCRSRSA